MSGTTNGANSSTQAVEPLAIVGIACRWPGASSVSEFEDMLRRGISGQSDVPSHYYNIDAFYHPNRERPGSFHTKRGYFMKEDTRNFDAAFFGISPNEAKTMDPQQRQVLEIAYECFESAGVSLDDISGTKTGCFVGNFTWEYSLQRFRDPEFSLTTPYGATGSTTTLLSNRINYVFNLKGPSMTLDTACSSSMYALHLACSSLYAGECNAALVAGVNLILGADNQMDCARLGVLSPTSACHTFDAAADGYARSEGVAALYVKKLDDAIKDGDPIRAIIRGTAVNTNGKTPGITHPSSEGQEAVIRHAYQRAGITNYHDTGYFECHGTGTPTGDPLEVAAVGKVFSENRDCSDPLLIGSVKTNLGHSEAASGMAGVIKAILTLESKTIFPTIGLLDFESCKVKVVTEQTPLPTERVSINSFGFGGTNAHAILDSADSFLRKYSPDHMSTNGHSGTNGHSNDSQRGGKLNGHANGTSVLPKVLRNGNPPPSREKNILLAISGRDDFSLQANLAAIKEVAANYKPADLAYTLGDKRTVFDHRCFAIIQDVNGTYEGSFDNVKFGKRSGNSLGIGFVFTGQGAQWPQMGLDLMTQFPIVLKRIRWLDGVLQKLPDRPDWTIESTLLEPEEVSQINDARLSQPLCTAVQIALVDLLSAWNIRPVATVGHSSGEIAGAYAAGFLTAKEAIVLAYYRGIVADQVKDDGAMLAVGLGVEEIRPYLEKVSGVVVACVNSPQSVTLSGERDAVMQVQQQLLEAKIFARILKTNGKAYHSRHMKQVGEKYQILAEERLGTLRQDNENNIAMVSSVTGRPVSSSSIPLSYWRENLESPVLFNKAVMSLCELGVEHLVEIGPHKALEGPLRQIRQFIGDEAPAYSATLLRGQNSSRNLLEMAGQLFLKGYAVDLGRVNAIESLGDSGEIITEHVKTLHNLPSYKWNHSRIFWEENRLSHDYKFRKHPRHDILGSRLPYGGTTEHIWRNMLRVKDVPWLAHHQVENKIVFPATGYMTMAIEAMTQVQEIFKEENGTTHTKIEGYCLSKITFSSALVIEDDAYGREVLFILSPSAISATKSSQRWYDFKITSTTANATVKDKWVQHCNGCIAVELSGSIEGPSISRHAQLERRDKVEIAETYLRMKNSGFYYGPSFQGLSELYGDWKAGKASATTDLYPTAQVMFDESRYVIHPAALDTALQVITMVLASGRTDSAKMNLPVFIETLDVWVHRGLNSSCEKATINALGNRSGVRSSLGDFTILCEDLQVECKGLRLHAFDTSVSESSSNGKVDRNPYMRLVWRPDIEKLTSDQAKRFLSDKTRLSLPLQSRPEKTEQQDLLALLDLYAHKNPGMSMLQVGATGFLPFVVEILQEKTNFKRFSKYSLVAQDAPTTEQIFSRLSHYTSIEEIPVTESFHIIVFLEMPNKMISGARVLQQLRKQLLPKGTLILSRNLWDEILKLDSSALSSNSFEDRHILTDSHVLLRAHDFNSNPPKISDKRIILMHRSKKDPVFSVALEETAVSQGWEVTHTYIDKADIPENSRVISMVGLQGPPFLEDIDEADLKGLQLVASKASSVIWLTARSGQMPSGSNSANAMMAGLGRSIMLEEPKLQFHVLELESPERRLSEVCQIIWDHAENMFSAPRSSKAGIVPDREYEERDGILCISRLVPDTVENSVFNSLINPHRENRLVQRKIEGSALRMELGQVGQPDSLYFEEDTEVRQHLDPEYLEIQVKAAGMNNKDLVMLMGIFDAKSKSRPYFFSNECAGVVSRVGKNVKNILPGDRVVAFAPGYYGTVERFPAYMCQRLLPNEDFQAMVTMPVVYTTAIYAFQHLARLQAGETVLIHSGAGGVGIAAITLAKTIGAEIYTTVSTEERKKFLQEKFGLPADHIFHSRDRSFATDLKRATNGKGVDVILSAHTGDLLHETWTCLAPYGRFVDIGRREVLDHGKLDMSVFARNTTFASFDMGLVSWERPALFASLLEEMMTLYRAGKITPIQPTTIFDISDLSKAMRQFMRGVHVGKIVINYENPESCVMYKPKDSLVFFKPDASYLLIGALGGLGRSLISWMIERGARYFVFLSRSGVGNQDSEAAAFVKEITQMGVDVVVVKGDVSIKEDVIKTFKSANVPIKGIVHAAMVLRDGLFSRATAEEFRTVVRPKHHGAKNLHEASLKHEHELDFFLSMSSLSGVLGTLSQSNYSAANSSLDALARLRQGLGLPFASVALGGVSQVGYIAEHPEIAAGLARNGFYPINEREYLLAIEAGIRWQLQKGQKLDTSVADMDIALNADPGAANYLVTGLEPIKLKEMLSQGFEGGSYVKLDPRLSVIANALEIGSADTSRKEETTTAGRIKQSLLEEGKDQAIALLTTSFVEKLSNLLLLPVEELDANNSMVYYGLDSMIGGELRIWLYREFGVDISFLELSVPTMTIRKLLDGILKHIESD